MPKTGVVKNLGSCLFESFYIKKQKRVVQLVFLFVKFGKRLKKGDHRNEYYKFF